MRRLILPALLALLVLAPPAHAAGGGGTTEIIRDCIDDSVLDGHYTLAQLRKARANLPTDVDEYSDCRDVLSRAISDLTQAAAPPPPPSDGSGGGSGGATGGGGSGGSGGSAPAPTPNHDQDVAALKRAQAHGGAPVQVGGATLAPGSATLVSAAGGNSLPTSMLVVLALLAAAVLAAIAPFLRRHVRARRPA